MKKVLFISDTLAHDAKDPISNMVNQFLRLEFFKDSQKAIIEPRTNIFEKFKEEKHVSPYGMPYVELLTPKINGGGVIS